MWNVAVTFQNKVSGLVDYTKTELVRANSKHNKIFLLFYRQLFLLCWYFKVSPSIFHFLLTQFEAGKASCCFLRKWFFSLHDQNVFGWFDVSTCNGQLHIRLNLIGVTFRYKSSVRYFRCGIQENTSYWKFGFNNKENKFWKIKKEFKKWGKEINVSFCALALCTFCNLEKKELPSPLFCFHTLTL